MFVLWLLLWYCTPLFDRPQYHKSIRKYENLLHIKKQLDVADDGHCWIE